MYLHYIFQANRAVSEHNSMGSRHRRKSVPSFASQMLSGGSRRSRSSPRAGSVDPLLDGSLSDGGDSGTLHHLSVSRGDLDRYSFLQCDFEVFWGLLRSFEVFYICEVFEFSRIDLVVVILKGEQKLGVTFNSDKLGSIDFTKFSKLTMCSA